MCSPAGRRWLLGRHTHLHRRIEFQPIGAGNRWTYRRLHPVIRLSRKRPIFETTRRLPARMADALVRHAAWCRPGYGPAYKTDHGRVYLRRNRVSVHCHSTRRQGKPRRLRNRRTVGFSSAKVLAISWCAKSRGWLWPRKVLGAVMSVVLIGPMNRCANCRRIPPEGHRWPHVADGDRFCSLDCLYGLYPELEEGGQ
jgi:hypothetical protein